MSSKCSDLRQHIFIVSYFLGVRNSAWLSWVSLAPGLRRLQSRCWLGLQSFQGSNGREVTMPLEKLLQKGRRSLLPGNISSLSEGPLHWEADDMAAGFPQNKAVRESQRVLLTKTQSLYNPILEIASLHFCYILFLQCSYIIHQLQQVIIICFSQSLSIHSPSLWIIKWLVSVLPIAISLLHLKCLSIFLFKYCSESDPFFFLSMSAIIVAI